MSQTAPQTNPRRVGDLSPTRQPTRNRCTAWVTACSLTHPTNRITAQTQKVTALQTHKKGLMQQLFPAQAEARA